MNNRPENEQYSAHNVEIPVEKNFFIQLILLEALVNDLSLAEVVQKIDQEVHLYMSDAVLRKLKRAWRAVYKAKNFKIRELKDVDLIWLASQTGVHTMSLFYLDLFDLLDVKEQVLQHEDTLIKIYSSNELVRLIQLLELD